MSRQVSAKGTSTDERPDEGATGRSDGTSERAEAAKHATTGADSGFELLDRERDRMDARLEPLTPRDRSDAQASEVPRSRASASDMFGKAESRS